VTATEGRNRRADRRLWTLLLFLGGIDGFKLLEPLHELGARPFFLVFVPLVAAMLVQGRARIDLAALRGLGLFWLVSLVGFVYFGADLPPFGDKTPSTQFAAHAVLFLIGFSPIVLRLRRGLDEQVLVDAAIAAMALHGVFIAVDELGLLTGAGRPFASSFLGAVDRAFPTGLFSEPSYVAAYVGVLLPVVLLRARVSTIVACSVVASALFFMGDVRSFFVIYAVGLFSLIVLRWGLNLWALLGLAAIMGVVGVAAVMLNLLSVEESLSSAYRLGNTVSYLDRAVSDDVFLGEGFGAAHFLYPSLDFPAYMYLSTEFADMLTGAGNRVPVFNLWVRLAVEAGLLPTLALLAAFAYRFVFGRIAPVARIFVLTSFAYSLSTDSYIYGMFTLALVLMWSVPVLEPAPLRRARRREPDTRGRSRAAVPLAAQVPRPGA